ncbi:hypothetical protein [Brevibacillus porteri]
MRRIQTWYHAWQLRRAARLEAKAERIWGRHFIAWNVLRKM